MPHLSLANDAQRRQGACPLLGRHLEADGHPAQIVAGNVADEDVVAGRQLLYRTRFAAARLEVRSSSHDLELLLVHRATVRWQIVRSKVGGDDAEIVGNGAVIRDLEDDRPVR